jgi:hypothetical protein
MKEEYQDINLIKIYENYVRMPCRGLILLNINHTATGATEGSLVSVATSVSSS